MALSDAAARLRRSAPWPSTSGSRTWTRSSRSRCSSTPRAATGTRCTGTTTSRSRWWWRAAARSCSAGGRCAAEPGDIFFIDNSPAARRARGPGLAAAPAARPVPPGAPRRARLPGAGPGLPRAVPRGRADRSPRVRGDDAARRRGRPAPPRAARHPRAAATPPSATSPTPRCAWPSRWSTATRAPRATAGATRAAADRREQIRPVLAYVDGHCRESITLDDVADLVHVSPSRVRHVFKDVTGVELQGVRHPGPGRGGEAPAARRRTCPSRRSRGP